MSDGSEGPAPDRGCPPLVAPVARPALLVSACLLGVACTHVGGHEHRDAVADLGARYRLIGVCPETAGGLPTPRPAAERDPVDGRVHTADGADLTAAYERGAAHAVAVALAVRAVGAVLKERSPSCAPGELRDGSFTGSRVAGEGVTAGALRRAGIVVRSEADVAAGWGR